MQTGFHCACVVPWWYDAMTPLHFNLFGARLDVHVRSRRRCLIFSGTCGWGAVFVQCQCFCVVFTVQQVHETSNINRKQVTDLNTSSVKSWRFVRSTHLSSDRCNPLCACPCIVTAFIHKQPHQHFPWKVTRCWGGKLAVQISPNIDPYSCSSACVREA